MNFTILSILTVAIICIVFPVIIERYSKEDPILLFSLVILSILIYVKSGDFVLSAVLFLSAISVLTLYTPKFYLPFVLLFVIVVLLALEGEIQNTSLAVSLGTAVPLFMSEKLAVRIDKNGKKRGDTSGIELKRDFFQIFVGVITMLLFWLLPMVAAESLVVVCMFILYLLGNYAHQNRSRRISVMLFSMEREGVDLGIGSLMLAVGVLFVFGLTNHYSVIVLALFLVLISDPVATIAGKKIGGRTLPYNRRKTYSGFGTALLVTTIFVYFTLAPFYLIFAVAGTFIESAVREPLDDNLVVPLSIVALNYVIGIL